MENATKLALLDSIGFKPETQEETYRPQDFTDEGNTDLFYRLYGDKAKHTEAAGWFVWNGRYWEEDDKSAFSLAIEMSQKMLSAALTEHNSAIQENRDTSDAKTFLKHAESTRSGWRLREIINIASRDNRFKCKVADFNPNPFDYNTPAGIVDLRSGKMRPHDPAAMCSKITSCSPGTKGKRQWGEYLMSTSDNDEQKVFFKRQNYGRGLIGKVFEEGLTLLKGPGANGKSTEATATTKPQGSYAGHINAEILTTEKQKRGAALAELQGKRFVFCGELEENQRLSTSVLKKMTSTDLIDAERKFRKPESFIPTHTLYMFTNHLPKITALDHGTWRRIVIIPFNNTISKENAIPNYGDVLAENCGPAILQWLIDGARDFISNGCKLLYPDSITAAIQEYRQEQNWLQSFIDDCCQAGDRAPGGELYKAYRDWCEQTGEYCRKQSDFVKTLQQEGYKSVTYQNRKFWLGIELQTL